MKQARRWTWLVFIAVIMTTALPPVWGAPPAAPNPSAQGVGSGYLENVTFEKLPGKERVTFTVSKQSGVTVENQPGNALLVRLENLFVPEGLRRPLGDASLANVIRVTPVQKAADGRSWVLATIELRQKVPYSVRQEGMNVLIDFNVTSLASAAGPAPGKPSSPVTAPGGAADGAGNGCSVDARERSSERRGKGKEGLHRFADLISTFRVPISRRYSGSWPSRGMSASFRGRMSRGR